MKQCHHSFNSKKQKILDALLQPAESCSDASPKGSVDDGIRELISSINSMDAYVTTSSCSGRLAIFMDGCPTSTVRTQLATEFQKPVDAQHDLADANDMSTGEELAPVAPSTATGKGSGGRWLFVSHDPLDTRQRNDQTLSQLLGFSRGRCNVLGQVVSELLPERRRFVHFKFEPMVLVSLPSLFSHRSVRWSQAFCRLLLLVKTPTFPGRTVEWLADLNCFDCSRFSMS